MISIHTIYNHFSWCEDCIENTNCGFCYENTKKGVTNGSCLPTAKDITHAADGVCNATKLTDDWWWAYQYCPTPYSWIGVLGLALYLMFFAPGMSYTGVGNHSSNGLLIRPGLKTWAQYVCMKKCFEFVFG